MQIVDAHSILAVKQPPLPFVTVVKQCNGRKVIWSMPDSEETHEEIQSYQIKAAVALAQNFVNLQTVPADQPNACIYEIDDKTMLYFSVRAVDKFNRPGLFSIPVFSDLYSDNFIIFILMFRDSDQLVLRLGQIWNGN